MDKKRLQELAGINVNTELLNEEGMYYNPRNNNYLYHYTNIYNLLGILEDGFILKAPYSHYDGEKRYISFTRNKNFNFGADVRIVINRDKLKQRYKLEPYHYNPFREDDSIHKTQLEERIKGDVNIKNSIVMVYIETTNYQFNKESINEYKKILIPCLKILKQNNIPFHTTKNLLSL